MHSYILTSYNSNQAQNKIANLSNLDLDPQKWNAHPDIHQIYPSINEKTVTKTKSIKIDQIRALQKKLSQKPLSLGFNLAIIWEAEHLTLSAQNSFLKILEESSDSYIFLITSTLSPFLSTIKSRCQILISNDQQSLDINPKYQELFVQFNDSSPIQRLKLVEKYQKTLSSSQDLVLQFINIVRSNSKSNLKPNLILLQNLMTSHTDLNRNINRKLVLDQLCFNWKEKLIFSI